MSIKYIIYFLIFEIVILFISTRLNFFYAKMKRNKEECSDAASNKNRSKKPYYFVLQIVKMKILYFPKFYILFKILFKISKIL